MDWPSSQLYPPCSTEPWIRNDIRLWNGRCLASGPPSAVQDAIESMVTLNLLSVRPVLSSRSMCSIEPLPLSFEDQCLPAVMSDCSSKIPIPRSSRRRGNTLEFPRIHISHRDPGYSTSMDQSCQHIPRIFAVTTCRWNLKSCRIASRPTIRLAIDPGSPQSYITEVKHMNASEHPVHCWWYADGGRKAGRENPFSRSDYQKRHTITWTPLPRGQSLTLPRNKFGEHSGEISEIAVSFVGTFSLVFPVNFGLLGGSLSQRTSLSCARFPVVLVLCFLYLPFLASSARLDFRWLVLPGAPLWIFSCKDFFRIFIRYGSCS